MLIGEYIHTLDPKKRLSLPAKFRKEVGKKVVITAGLDNCLFVYPLGAWKEHSKKIGELSMGQSDSRSFARHFLGRATETDVDTNGRVLISDSLKKEANLKEKVAIIGMYDRIEIWNERAWHTYKDGVGKKADSLAEKLGDIGAI